jgi:predicted transcriptional regulator
VAKKKFIVEFSEELDEMIDKLARKQDLPKTQVVKQALSLLNYIEDQRTEGHRFTIEDKTGRVLGELVQ